jgi:hypothetical protein
MVSNIHTAYNQKGERKNEKAGASEIHVQSGCKLQTAKTPPVAVCKNKKASNLIRSDVFRPNRRKDQLPANGI